MIGMVDTTEQLTQRATEVLRENDLGTMVMAAPRLYPHQWSWDAAFITIGLARVSVPRAITEMRTLLHAQWDTGMIPHIVFSEFTGYFPGPDVWGTDAAEAKPAGVQTSGICQPPVHAIAVARVLEAGRALGGRDEEEAEAFAIESVPKLAAWHRWLSNARDRAVAGWSRSITAGSPAWTTHPDGTRPTRRSLWTALSSFDAMTRRWSRTPHSARRTASTSATCISSRR
jgi:glucosylglycerate hydrolase